MSDKKKTVLVRADANRQIGIGHAMRCLAVAEQLVADGHKIVFCMHQVPQALLARLDHARVKVLIIEREQNSAAGICEIAKELSAEYAIIDGYQFDDEYEECLSDQGIRTLRFDDIMPYGSSTADVVVNASPHAKESAYRNWAPRATLLLGPKHIAFRSEMISAFLALESAKARKYDLGETTDSGSILVNFGGSDHLDMTIRTVKEIAKILPDACIEAVTGAAYPNPERLSSLGLKNLLHHHNSDNLPEVMQRARMAISAGGLTVAELALFRIPTILAITAQNQVKGAHVSWCHTILPESSADKIDTSEMLRKILIETEHIWNLPEERAEIISRIPTELDINGAKRIADALLRKKTA